MSLAIEPNNQVLGLWREQSRFFDKTPEMMAIYVSDIEQYLGALHERAGLDVALTGHINSIWTRVQGLQTLMAGQALVLASAGIIIPALKVQRDELAVELAAVLEKLGGGQNPIEGMLSALYDSWRDTLETEDFESDGQDELAAIKDDIENVWNLPEGYGEMVLMALRGREEVSSRSANLFVDFLNSLAQDAANE